MRSQKSHKRLERDFNYCRSVRHVALALLLICLLGAQVPALSQQFSPGKNIEAVGVPPIPATLPREVGPTRASTAYRWLDGIRRSAKFG